jgi:hypothetical protein
VIAVCVGVLLSGCSSSADTVVKPLDQVDLAGWRSQFVARTSTSNDPDMDDLYEATVGYCADSVDDLALKFAAPSVDPSLVGLGLSYVCPGEAAKVNEADRDLANSSSAFATACATPKDQRTKKQQELAGVDTDCPDG